MNADRRDQVDRAVGVPALRHQQATDPGGRPAAERAGMQRATGRAHRCRPHSGHAHSRPHTGQAAHRARPGHRAAAHRQAATAGSHRAGRTARDRASESMITNRGLGPGPTPGAGPKTVIFLEGVGRRPRKLAEGLAEPVTGAV